MINDNNVIYNYVQMVADIYTIADCSWYGDRLKSIFNSPYGKTIDFFGNSGVSTHPPPSVIHGDMLDKYVMKI